MRPWVLMLLLLGAGLTACDTSPRIMVQWTTGTEIDTAGFNLYRSDHPDGPYVKINPQLIAASSDPVAGGKYQFADNDVVAGKTYYYQLEDVEYGGKTERHGPIVATASADTNWTLLGIVALIALGALGAWTLSRRRVEKESQ